MNVLSPSPLPINPVAFHLAGVALISGGVGRAIRMNPIGAIALVAGGIALVVVGAPEQKAGTQQERTDHKRHRYISKHA